MLFKNPSDTDYPQIYHLLDRAFAPGISESALVKNLRARGKIAFDFIIENNGKVLAYICYSSAYDSARTRIGFHLAPLAVLPGKQRRRFGEKITTESLKVLPKGRPVYVLGSPEYYRKFGFRIDKTQKCGFDPEGNHFMVLSDHPLPPREVLYENEFNI